jgi:hypothetical protein
MIEHHTKSKSKNPKKLNVKYSLTVLKNPIQSNNPTKIQQKSIISNFFFGCFGWIFNRLKSRKEFLILVITKKLVAKAWRQGIRNSNEIQVPSDKIVWFLIGFT